MTGDRLHFRVGHMEDAERLILKHHYSRRMAGNIQYVCTWHTPGGLFGDYGEPVAACTFSIPPTRWALPVLELSRLVRVPELKDTLTSFLSLACNMLKRRGETLLVSFADNTQGHHGGVYQAASWNFSTYREPRMDGLLINGQFVPGRSCNSRWGTRSPTRLAERLGDSHAIEPHMDAGKFLYWKALNAKGRHNARLLDLGKTAYPKPALATEAAE
jgi:hypothetical protein